MSADTVDVSVGGEWSFAQTLRHLVMATDAWLGQSILGIDQLLSASVTSAKSSARTGAARPSPAAVPSA